MHLGPSFRPQLVKLHGTRVPPVLLSKSALHVASLMAQGGSIITGMQSQIESLTRTNNNMAEQVKAQHAQVEALTQELSVKDQLLVKQQAASDVAWQQAMADQSQLPLQLQSVTREAGDAIQKVKKMQADVGTQTSTMVDVATQTTATMDAAASHATAMGNVGRLVSQENTAKVKEVRKLNQLMDDVNKLLMCCQAEKDAGIEQSPEQDRLLKQWHEGMVQLRCGAVALEFELHTFLDEAERQRRLDMYAQPAITDSTTYDEMMAIIHDSQAVQHQIAKAGGVVFVEHVREIVKQQLLDYHNNKGAGVDHDIGEIEELKNVRESMTQLRAVASALKLQLEEEEAARQSVQEPHDARQAAAASTAAAPLTMATIDSERLLQEMPPAQDEDIRNPPQLIPQVNELMVQLPVRVTQRVLIHGYDSPATSGPHMSLARGLVSRSTYVTPHTIPTLSVATKNYPAQKGKAFTPHDFLGIIRRPTTTIQDDAGYVLPRLDLGLSIQVFLPNGNGLGTSGYALDVYIPRRHAAPYKHVPGTMENVKALLLGNPTSTMSARTHYIPSNTLDVCIPHRHAAPHKHVLGAMANLKALPAGQPSITKSARMLPSPRLQQHMGIPYPRYLMPATPGFYESVVPLTAEMWQLSQPRLCASMAKEEQPAAQVEVQSHDDVAPSRDEQRNSRRHSQLASTESGGIQACNLVSQTPQPQAVAKPDLMVDGCRHEAPITQTQHMSMQEAGSLTVTPSTAVHMDAPASSTSVPVTTIHMGSPASINTTPTPTAGASSPANVFSVPGTTIHTSSPASTVSMATASAGAKSPTSATSVPGTTIHTSSPASTVSVATSTAGARSPTSVNSVPVTTIHTSSPASTVSVATASAGAKSPTSVTSVPGTTIHTSSPASTVSVATASAGAKSPTTPNSARAPTAATRTPATVAPTRSPIAGTRVPAMAASAPRPTASTRNPTLATSSCAQPTTARVQVIIEQQPGVKLQATGPIEHFKRAMEAGLLARTSNGYVLHLRVGEYLGEGAFGQVHKAIDVRTKQQFALKRMDKIEMTVRQQQDFFNERDITLMCESPFCNKGFASFISNTEVFLLLELMPGGSLAELLMVESSKRNAKKHFWQFWQRSTQKACKKGMPEHMARDCIARVVKAVGDMHSRNIVHRDLKPENVLVNSEGKAVVCDMGIAVQLDASGLAHGSIGTPQYMAPEVLTEKSYTRSVDIWSLGATLLELMTNTTPFVTLDDKYDEMSVNEKKEWTAKTLVPRLKDPEYSIQIPRYLSKAAQDLLSQLLTRDPTVRLGMQADGIGDIMNHRWFKGYNWSAVA